MTVTGVKSADRNRFSWSTAMLRTHPAAASNAATAEGSVRERACRLGRLRLVLRLFLIR